MTTVVEISAIGTRGKAAGKKFKAKKDADGMYVLNRKTSSPTTGNITNYARNKVGVVTLNEAARLLLTDKFLINLMAEDRKKALRALKKVVIKRA
ncbi:MAG: hypothetical protein JSR55_09655 [Proteobacteria bacterium]|nr:hypothetical protein [Pseudomonadota bacterium]